MILEVEPKIGMVTSYVKRYKGQNTSFTQKLRNPGGIEDFLVTNYANASLLFRYECWENTGGYDEEILGFEDWEFFISVTKRGWYIYSIPEYLFSHLMRDDSVYDKDLKKRPEIIK